MKTVLATGVFDLLHPGHLYYLNEARALGDYLVVLVASDVVVKKEKAKPYFNEGERAQMIASLKMVDEAVVGNRENNYCATVNSLQPDIIALGYDQKFKILNLQKQLEKCGWHGKIIRINKYPNKNQSTTKIKRTIKNL